MKPQVDFFTQTRQQLGQYLEENFALPAYRAGQILHWVYKKGVTDCHQMSNLSRDLQAKLAEILVFPEAEIADRQISSDGTRKYLLKVSSGSVVESVMIKQPGRMTLCVSSQVGCGMGCGFCRTATMGFRRNLSASEIIQQVRAVIKDAQNFGDMFQNIVFMGMGEPLHNYNNLLDALSILRDQQAFDFSGRRITVSSVGLVPAIERFGKSAAGVNLAISLNATTDEVRSKIMPINKAFPLEKLLSTLREYPLKPRQRITIEYVMLSGVNDTEADLKRLPKLLKGIPVKVNLIPYNQNADLGFNTPPTERVHYWRETLHRTGLNTTIRWSKGQDIKAACGQLAAEQMA